MTGDTVSGVKVTWTPAATGDFDIDVKAGGQTGNLNIPTSGTSQRTDTVSLGSAVEASTVTTAKVVISEN